MSEKPSKRMGRPPKQIDKEQFEKLCLLQCTEEEIAGWFDCSVDTIERWVKREYAATFAEIYAKYKEKGRISIRRAQFKLMQTSAPVAIWMGKQYLGQREPSQNLSLDGVDGEGVKVNITIADCSKGGEVND